MKRNLFIGTGFIATLGVLGIASYLLEKKSVVQAATATEIGRASCRERV